MILDGLKKNIYRLIAQEICAVSRYYDCLFQWVPPSSDHELLFHDIECPAKTKLVREDDLEDFSRVKHSILILFNGNFNYQLDLQKLLLSIRPKLNRHSRLVSVIYNPYLKWFYWILDRLRLRNAEPITTFITRTDLLNIAKISGFEIVRTRPVGYFPFKLFGIGSFLNHIMTIIPIVRWFAYVNVVILRPMIAEMSKPSLSIIVPARNEKGNIESVVKRIPKINGVDTEVIFVEGHSRDGTWEEIGRIIQSFPKFKISAYQQEGKGKSDAVRLGFSKASNDILAILDADLSMPPELLPRFYDAYCQGLADFINGSRLVYPMEGEAMKFLNHLGNIFFAKKLSYVLESRIGDSLCGTKLLSRCDYQRFIKWRKDFGEFDPFGDFELLFPAAILGLGIVDIPIHYKSRTYGTTNISRFQHGWMLLKMVLIGFFKVRIGH